MRDFVQGDARCTVIPLNELHPPYQGNFITNNTEPSTGFISRVSMQLYNPFIVS